MRTLARYVQLGVLAPTSAGVRGDEGEVRSMMAEPAVARERILLVDDEPQVLVALKDLLSDKFTVFTAASAASALDVVEHEPAIAVVMTDQRMPRMTGDELLSRLGDASDAARIMISAFADLPAVIRAVNDGRIFAYITKPWNDDGLLLTVSKAAEHCRLLRQLAEERSLLESSERRLRSQTAVLNSVLDSMGDGVLVMNREDRLVVFNRRAELLLGRPSSDTLTTAWAGFGVHPIDEQEPLAHGQSPVHRAMVEERTVSLEALVRSPGAPDKLLAITATPLRDASGVAGGVALLRDITQQRELEQKLMHSQKMDAIGRFAGGVVHDFNNLLSVIQSYAQLILSGASEGRRLPEDLGQIVGASERAAALTRQLLAFCRREELRPKLLALNPVIVNVEKMLRRILGADIVLSTELARDLGIVRADPGQIDQVILNLAVNARDAMSQGGRLSIETANKNLGKAEAQLVGIPAGDYVTLAIADTGIGMDASTRKRIFEPFFTTKEVGKGTGLGLSTVYGIVQQASAYITVDSEVGQGTTFRIYFPHAVGQPSAIDEEEPLRRSSSVRSGTILLVEDNDAVRLVAARILRGGGHTVLDAADADEARRLCRERSRDIDLLLFDVVMPHTSGPALAAELSELCGDARVLFMSGYSGSNSPTDASWRSRADFLEKPFSPATLLEKVRETLAATGD